MKIGFTLLLIFIRLRGVEHDIEVTNDIAANTNLTNSMVDISVG